jgi:hypothetical protein
MTGPQPLPKRVLHRLRTSFLFPSPASSLFLKVIYCSLHLLPHLPFTYIFPSIFPATKYFKRQFLRKMRKCSWLSFFLLYVGNFSPPWFYVIPLHFTHDRSNCSSPAPRFKTSQALLIYLPQCSRFSSIHGEFETIWKNSINPLLCRWLNGNVNDISGRDPHRISFQDPPLLYVQLALLSLSPHKFARSPCCYYRVLEMKKFRRPGVLQWHAVISFVKPDKLVQNLNGGNRPPTPTPTNTVWWL